MHKPTNSRLDNITKLKQKLLDFQKHLNKIQKQQRDIHCLSPSRPLNNNNPHNTTSSRILNNNSATPGSISPSHHLTTTPRRFNYNTAGKTGVSPNKASYKNPTFWGENPILLGKENDESQKIEYSPSKSRFHTQKLKTQPNTKLSMNSTQFYIPKNPKLLNSTLQSINSSAGFRTVSPFNSTAPQLREVSPSGRLRIFSSKQKVQGIKTFAKPKVNPILNPPVQKSSCRKKYLSKQYQDTNQTLFNSNGNLGSQTPAFFSPTKSNRKNDSESLRNLLADSSMEKLGMYSDTPKCSKKHFTGIHFHEVVKDTIYTS